MSSVPWSQVLDLHRWAAGFLVYDCGSRMGPNCVSNVIWSNAWLSPAVGTYSVQAFFLAGCRCRWFCVCVAVPPRGSLQTFKVLGFAASVSRFFHRVDARLPGRPRFACVRALVCVCARTCAIFGSAAEASGSHLAWFGHFCWVFFFFFNHQPP